jgi:hypothetical protein
MAFVFSTPKNVFSKLFSFLAFAPEVTVAGKQYNHGANSNHGMHGLGKIVDYGKSICFAVAGMCQCKKGKNCRCKKEFTFHTIQNLKEQVKKKQYCIQ